MKITSIILAAGKGTRMKNNIPKVLNDCSGRTLLEHVILTQHKLSSQVKVICNMQLQQEPLYQKLQTQYNFASVVQAQQLGTADAVKQALPLETDKALILYGDVPLLTPATLENLCAQEADISILAFTAQNPTGYGRIIIDGSQVEAIIEEKDANLEQRKIDLCNSGIMLVKTAVLEKIIHKIDNNNIAKEFYLTDLIALAKADGCHINYVLATEEEALGVNDLKQLAAIDEIMQQRIQEQLQLSGVKLLNPESIYISADAEIAPGTVIYPQVFIGNNVKLHTDVTVHSFSHLEGVEVFAKARVGPFARLRPGTILEEGAVIGNFVEVKNSKIHTGVKASHLSYIGDAEIGKDSNIGAGTIFCNYDGKQKHRSQVGEKSMIGGNTSIVAPVKIGDNVTIGAGSTITKDVPDRTLALSRTKQQNLDKR